MIIKPKDRFPIINTYPISNHAINQTSTQVFSQWVSTWLKMIYPLVKLQVIYLSNVNNILFYIALIVLKLLNHRIPGKKANLEITWFKILILLK